MQLLSNVTLNFQKTRVFDNFSFAIAENKITAVLGPSGCGKTSILNLIAGFISPQRGRVDQCFEKIAYVFQEDRLLPWRTVYQNVALVGNDDKTAIMEVLRALSIDDVADYYPHELSGGMRQRCAIARAFYYDAPLLLMDEPYKSLDYDLKISMLSYLIKLWQITRTSIVYVTHDIDEALLLGHRILLLSHKPTAVIEQFQRDANPAGRTVNDEEHIVIRRAVISTMATLQRKESP